MKQTVLIGVTSGIAAYKVVELVKRLKRQAITVFVIMTHSATKMISPRLFKSASGNKVFTDLFEPGFNYKKILTTRRVNHIELAKSASLVVIVPATANTLAKLAHGLADDFLTTTVLAVTSPVIVCPSMNVNMWHHPLVQENIIKLKALGYHIIEPTAGELACGDQGKGRLEDIKIIEAEIIRQLHRSQVLKGKKIMVTAGATLEPIDAVRYITNRSSGKMGTAIAEACYLRGAKVFLLRSKTAFKSHYQIPEVTFATSSDLFEVIKNKISDFDILFHAAAVGDFRPSSRRRGKISSQKSFKLELKPQLKISDQIKRLNPRIKLIVFKAEFDLTESQLIKAAKQKLTQSQADAIVANDISRSDRGFQVDTNEVVIILKDGNFKKMPLGLKRDIAGKIVDFIIPKV